MGRSVHFGQQVRDGFQMTMYPDSEAIDVLALVRLAPPPLQNLQDFVDVYQRYYDDFRVATAP
jgi:hypothetical protein